MAHPKEIITNNGTKYEYFTKGHEQMPEGTLVYQGFPAEDETRDQLLVITAAELKALEEGKPYEWVVFSGQGKSRYSLSDMRVIWKSPDSLDAFMQASAVVAENVPRWVTVGGKTLCLAWSHFDPYENLLTYRDIHEGWYTKHKLQDVVREMRKVIFEHPDATKEILHGRLDGYECSTQGDSRFSAMCAIMPDGRTLEEWYQCGTLDGRGKGYEPGGTDWRSGKGKPPKVAKSHDELWKDYYGFWCEWAALHPLWMLELRWHALLNGCRLSDRFASSPVNQARALATWLNDNPLEFTDA